MRYVVSQATQITSPDIRLRFSPMILRVSSILLPIRDFMTLYDVAESSIFYAKSKVSEDRVFVDASSSRFFIPRVTFPSLKTF